MLREFDHRARGGCRDVDSLSRSLAADHLVRSSWGLCCGNWPAWWGSPADGVRGTGPAARGQVRPGAEQPRLRRAGTTKSPQRLCQSMNEARSSITGSRISTADEDTLERSVAPNIFEFATTVRSKAHHARCGGVIGGGCSADRQRQAWGHLPRKVLHQVPTSSLLIQRSGQRGGSIREASFLLRPCGGPHVLGLWIRETRQRHAAEVTPAVQPVLFPFRASLSTAYGRP